MRIAILGLGLIGGSIARALHTRRDPGWTVVAWTPGGAGPRLAVATGVIDDAPSDLRDAVEGADLIVLAAPPLACLELLRSLSGPLADRLAPDAVVTDVASTKGPAVALANDLRLRFVGGHPMAGSETSGFGAADPGLFEGRPWVIVPSADAPAVDRVEQLASACGARAVRMDADDHDVAVAGISHLPLVLAAALVEAVAGTPDEPRPGWHEAAELAASGWASMTRLARGDETMGSEIAATNASAIASRLRVYQERLGEWLALLEAPGGPDPDAIRDRLAASRARLEGGGG
jgi:prephenate dehydrogenase